MNQETSVFVLGNHVQACCWHVDRLPQAGETYQARKLTVEPGGKGLNVAIGLHRLGLDVRLLLGCGQDAAGDALLSLLRAEGLDSSGVLRFEEASGWGAGLIAADGQNAIAVYPGANLLLRPEHVRDLTAELSKADLVYGQFETAVTAVAEAFAIARHHGICTVLNPSPWQEPPASLRRDTQVLLVNETEAAALLGLSPPAQAFADWGSARSWLQPGLLQLWSRWPGLQLLVVTLGALGASAWRTPQDPATAHADVLFMPAPRVVAVDTVGAGDAFACGFVSQWLMQGRPEWLQPSTLESCLHLGQIMGAHMARTLGVLAALPRVERLSALCSELQPGPVHWDGAA